MSYITPSKVFRHLDRLDAWQQGAKAAPVTVEIDLTNVCSLGCQSCHFRHTHVAGPWAARDAGRPNGFEGTGTMADAAMLHRALGEMAEAGVKGVVFTGGGEPTLHPQFAQIVRRAHDVGLQIGLYTLGGHIGAELGALLSRVCAWVVVSLDAADARTYSREKGVPAGRFTAACEGITRLVGGAATIGVSFLLHRDNWTRTAEMVALSRSLGATYTTFRPTIQTADADLAQMVGDRSWVTEALPTLAALALEPDVEIDPDRYVEYRDWAGRGYPTCFGVRLVTQVTPDGRVWICPNRRGLPGSELGNLHAQPFAEIWAAHPGQWTDFSACRAMCRLHLVNTVLAEVYQPRAHEAFV